MKDVKILGAKKTPAGAENKTATENKVDLKHRSQDERTDVRKREHKALMKSLTMAQMSTGSMGKFDRKAGKNEPNAPTSQKVVKKKSNKGLNELNHDRKKESERNMKIFNTLQKKGDISVAGVGKARSTAHQDEGKIVKKAKRKDDGMRSQVNKQHATTKKNR